MGWKAVTWAMMVGVGATLAAIYLIAGLLVRKDAGAIEPSPLAGDAADVRLPSQRPCWQRPRVALIDSATIFINTRITWPR